MSYTLGSLFDGSGGFPLAGTFCGIEPLWAAEVEPYPVAVTRGWFPSMRHLGDVSRVNGAEIEPVDIITFGSPCQDLSVAGKRAGLKHEVNGDDETTRSGLFMEAVRIIKEMRAATNGKYPRFALWENVPGAFSSNGGEDFRTVLTELIRITEPGAVMPPVPWAGWAYADSYTGNGWSLAYRVFDAQFWGVPQRRRRIHLICDFGGQCAREVLFNRQGVRGHFETFGTQGQAIARDAADSSGADDSKGAGDPGGLDGVADLLLDDQGRAQITIRTDGVAPTLRAEAHGNLPCVLSEVASTLRAGAGAPKHMQDFLGRLVLAPCEGVRVYDARGNGDGQTVATLTGDHQNRVTDYTSIVAMATQQGGAEIRTDDKCPTITAAGMSGNNQPVICKQRAVFDVQRTGQYGENGVASTQAARQYKDATDLVVEGVAYGVDCRNCTEYPELNGTIQAKSNGGFSLNTNQVTRVGYIVRRLTPTECARLQGFPDRWGDIPHKDDLTPEELTFWRDVRNTHAAINGRAQKDYTPAQMLAWYNKLHTDSAEYKMWGNGIALPPALYCMQGIADALADDWMN